MSLKILSENVLSLLLIINFMRPTQKTKRIFNFCFWQQFNVINLKILISAKYGITNYNKNELK